MKKRGKKIISIVSAVFLLLTLCMIPTGSVSAETSTVVEWTDGITGGAIYFDASTGTITDSDYEVTEAVIPEKINGVTVTAIGERAFDHRNLTSVTIPASVKVIEDAAFTYSQSLAKITVDANNPNYSSDENGVLYNKDKTLLIQYPCGNSNKFFTIPSTVQTIGIGAFWDSKVLENITIPASIKTIDAYAFCNSESLTSVVIPKGVTMIEHDAFAYCDSLTSVTIPDTVTTIGDYAFFNCASLEKLIVDENNANYSSEDGVLYNKEKTVLIQYPTGNSRESFVIPNNVTTIGHLAFFFCESLTNVTIPGSVKTIEYSAFSGCESLTSVVIPKGVTTIENDAFGYCDSLTSVTIPDSVTTIGDYAFAYCKSLTSVVIPDSVTSIGGDAFRGCKNLERIFLPDKELSIGGGAIPDTTSQVKYSLEEKKVTITEIDLAEGKSTVDIPDTICGYPVIAVARSEQAKVGAHTCKGGTATFTAKALCALCGKEYGEVLHQPEMIEGTGQSVTAGTKKELTFRSDAAFADFIRVELDGKTLDEKYYTKKEGSTIITLSADYVATLSAGRHTISIVSTSGTAATTFTVNAQSPKTGDNSHMALWIALLFVSGGLLTVTGAYSKREMYSIK